MKAAAAERERVREEQVKEKKWIKSSETLIIAGVSIGDVASRRNNRWLVSPLYMAS